LKNQKPFPFVQDFIKISIAEYLPKIALHLGEKVLSHRDVKVGLHRVPNLECGAILLQKIKIHACPDCSRGIGHRSLGDD
jgi:hypothetical protein